MTSNMASSRKRRVGEAFERQKSVIDEFEEEVSQEREKWKEFSRTRSILIQDNRMLKNNFDNLEREYEAVITTLKSDINQLKRRNAKLCETNKEACHCVKIYEQRFLLLEADKEEAEAKAEQYEMVFECAQKYIKNKRLGNWAAEGKWSKAMANAINKHNSETETETETDENDI